MELFELSIASGGEISEELSNILGGIVRLTGTTTDKGGKPIWFTAIPYRLWANRGPTAMRVWTPESGPRALTPGPADQKDGDEGGEKDPGSDEPLSAPIDQADDADERQNDDDEKNHTVSRLDHR